MKYLLGKLNHGLKVDLFHILRGRYKDFNLHMQKLILLYIDITSCIDFFFHEYLKLLNWTLSAYFKVSSNFVTCGFKNISLHNHTKLN